MHTYRSLHTSLGITVDTATLIFCSTMIFTFLLHQLLKTHACLQRYETIIWNVASSNSTTVNSLETGVCTCLTDAKHHCVCLKNVKYPEALLWIHCCVLGTCRCTIWELWPYPIPFNRCVLTICFNDCSIKNLFRPFLVLLSFALLFFS